jgi:hypothetical protein
MTVDKTIRRVTSLEEQQAESNRYWQSLSIGDRLTAVWEASAAAYGVKDTDGLRSDRSIRRVPPSEVE